MECILVFTAFFNHSIVSDSPQINKWCCLVLELGHSKSRQLDPLFYILSGQLDPFFHTMCDVGTLVNMVGVRIDA